MPPLVDMMPLGNAADALSDLAYKFAEEMRRQGTTELPPDAWLQAFRSWLGGERAAL